jgi:hypothetical protein
MMNKIAPLSRKCHDEARPERLREVCNGDDRNRIRLRAAGLVRLRNKNVSHSKDNRIQLKRVGNPIANAERAARA